ncbi:nucleoporin p54 [Onthophagus taurus]|uniref:nucleoporin p54 n=1 Tax=Onthophagus taurus TaxID=166361 RepID=UPI0039BE3F48
MAFSFGQSSFGQTAKPTGFGGGAFGTPTTSSAGFGGFGTSFGAPAASTTPAFGTSFGTTVTSTAPAFGTSFGTPASSAPAFGSTFGAPPTSTFGTSFGTPATSAPAFGTVFGAQTTSTPSLFGTPAQTTKPSLFGAPVTSASGGLFSTSGGGLFGSGGSTQIAGGGLFGATTTSTPSLFGAGGVSTSTPSLFGTSFGAATTSAGTGTGLFGSAGSSFGGGLFGATTTTTNSLFSGFGATTTTTASTGFGFGTQPGGFGTGNLFATGLKPQTSTVGVVSAAENKLQQTLASFYAINVFGDERDDILKKWNMLQACWGTGKGYYNASQPPVEYNQSNPFYRFKGIGYVVIPQPDNADGLVKLQFNKKESEVSAMKDTLINGINGILGNKPNLTLTIEHIKDLADSECEVMISVLEKGVTGTNRKIHASDLASFLNQPTQKQQLSTVGVTYIGPYMTPTKSQLEEYLKIPPPGIDNQMWQAAQIDNPHPQKYLPTPINGFYDLKKRLLCEEYETGLHRAFLEKVSNDINELKKKQAASLAHINEYKQKFLQLQHRVLKILVKQEVSRKAGMALQPEEEALRSRLEIMHSQLSIPTQFKGQLNELISSVKLLSTEQACCSNNERYKMEPKVQDDVKQFLQMEQNGIAYLINVINNDLKDLKLIQYGLLQFLNK